MSKIKIVILISILSILINLSLTGCTNEKKELNQSLIITEDVKEDSEPELKVISTEEFKFNDIIECFSFIPVEKEDDSTLIRITAGNDIGRNVVTKVNGDKISVIDERYIQEEPKLSVSKSFYVEPMDDEKVLITNWYTDDKYEVEKSLINNEDSRYVLLNEYLVEFVGGASWINFTTECIGWTNLNTGSSGKFEMPEDLDTALYASVTDDKLFVAVTSLEACEKYNEKLENNFVGYLLPDTVLVIDLSSNEVIHEAMIGSFRDFKVIDSDRIIFVLDNENNDNVELTVAMYSLNNKIKKEIMKYFVMEGENSINLNGIGVFPSRDKLYYCENNGETLSLKIAEINGMDIENVITAYEATGDLQSFTANSISIRRDGRELNIFNKGSNGEISGIDKLIKVRLNK